MDNIEIEVKALLENPEEIKNIILNKGAVLKEKKYQHDILLDPPNTDFEKTDQVLRIRNTNGNWKIDYKSPRLDNETKSRKEYTVKIEEGNQLKEIFSWLGFKTVGEIEKSRETYNFENMKINFDNVTNLGNFMEVEIIGNEENFELSKKQIFVFLKSIGINETIKKDYLELLWEKGYFKKP
ncbi:class IV adenylate cyclase [Candidatus Woesearchaeota archaeon]|nr:class IV adenylate cyclase [Candidatus Woesearchaeota archaeon]